MSTTTVTNPADAYLAEVRRHLADLADLTDDERDDLLDELTAHVHEVAASDDRPLDDVLGAPETFAAELLASAGLAREDGPPVRAAAARRAAGRLATSASVAWHHPWARALLAFLPELRPAWWVARGWLLVYGFWLIGAEDGDSLPLPEVLDSTFLGLVAAVSASVASVHLARRTPPPRWRNVVNALAIVAAVVLFMRADDLARAGTTYDEYDYQAPPSFGLTHPDGMAITNIYAYDAAGQPLDRVRLYDQTGRPVEILDTADALGMPLERNVVVGADGLPVTNLYPLDQFSVTWGPNGQTTETRPVAPPAVSVPPLPPAPTSTTVPDPGAAPPAPGS